MGCPQLLPNGDLLIPLSAEHDGVLADGAETIRPDDPRYAEMRAVIERLTSPAPEKTPPDVHRSRI